MAATTRTRSRMSVPERRALILDAATQLIGDRGFRGMSLRDVAVLAGITEAGVLYHVGSKDGLLVAVLEHRDEVDMASLAQRLGVDVETLDEDPLPVTLPALCRALVDRNALQPQIVRLYATLEAESLEADHPANAYFRERETWALGLFARAATTSGVEDPARTSLAMLSLMDGLQLRWLRDPTRIDLVREWEALSEVFLGGPRA